MKYKSKREIERDRRKYLCECNHDELDHEEVNDRDFNGEYYYRNPCTMLDCTCRDFTNLENNELTQKRD